MAQTWTSSPVKTAIPFESGDEIPKPCIFNKINGKRSQEAPECGPDCFQDGSGPHSEAKCAPEGAPGPSFLRYFCDLLEPWAHYLSNLLPACNLMPKTTPQTTKTIEFLVQNETSDHQKHHLYKHFLVVVFGQFHLAI